jgi:hypothetical protein
LVVLKNTLKVVKALQEKLLQQNEGIKGLLETLIKENEPKSMGAIKSDVVTKTIKMKPHSPLQGRT